MVEYTFGSGETGHRDYMETNNLLLQPLLDRAACTPERAAIVHRGHTVSYGELARRVAARAAELRRRGIGRGDRVLVFVPMSIPLYEILLALFSVGAVAVFIDAWAGARRIDHAAALAECKGFVGIPKAFLLLLASRALRRIPVKFLPSFGRHAVGSFAAPVPSGPDDPALITFTTGSTGEPKAALRTVGFLLEQLRVLRAELGVEEGDVDLATLPVFVLANLACGTTTLLPDFNPARPADYDPARVRAEAAALGVTTTSGSPAFYERLLEGLSADTTAIQGLRRLHVGGAAVWPDFAARLRAAFPGAAVRALYGSTEAEPIACIDAAELAACRDLSGGLPAGTPSPYLRLAVIPIGTPPPDRELSTEEWVALAVSEGEPGELCVAGPHVLKTYFRNDATLRENKIRVGDEIWHRTGDAARFAGGHLFLLGRASRAFRDADGAWRFPMLLEARLRAIPGVAVGTVLRLPDGRLAAAIEPDGSVPASDLSAAVEAAAMPHDFIRVLPTLPRDPRHRSKIDYGALVETLARSGPGGSPQVSESISRSSQPDAADARRAAWLVALCCVAYFTSYITRKGYDASILAICEATGLARTAAGLASTAAVALYGSGQFVTGFLADRFDPRKIILLALLVTAGCNIAMPSIIGCVPAMVALWAVNGFAQAMFWPPIVKIVAMNLRPAAYKGAVFWISVMAQIANIAVFLLVSGCIRFAGWRLSFAVVTAAAIATAVTWAVTIRRLAPQGTDSDRSRPSSTAASSKRGLWPLVIASGLLPIMAVIACQGILRDGIEVWASSIVKDQYNLGTSGSIFSVALLPVFAVLSITAARALRRWLGDEIKGSVILFSAGFVCSTLLFATNGASFATGLPLLGVLSASMHGANLLLIAELPGRFARHGRVGTISGLLNAFTYVGAAISIYGFPALHERFQGWRPVFAVWMAVLALGSALLLLALRRWLAFTRDA